MKKIILLVLTFICVIALGSVYKIEQTEQALILEFGKPVGTENEPGLHFKKPFMFQTILKFDNRVLSLDAKPRNLIASEGSRDDSVTARNIATNTAEGLEATQQQEEAMNDLQDNNTSRIIVDAFAKYKIIDPRQFYERVKNERTLNDRLDSILEANLREVVGGYSLHALLTEQRNNIMEQVRNRVNKEMRLFGIDVVDVRIMRADLPPKNFDTVINRMRAEREKEAREFRAQGAEEAQIITSTADKRKSILLATAEKKSQKLRGEGDANATQITATAFGVDADFYGFYRSMEAYKNTLKEGNTSMILSPDSDFFRYFGKLD